MSASLSAQSWTRRGPDEELEAYPDPLLVLALFALCLAFLGIAAWHNHDCREWAGSNPTRVAACEELNR